MARKRAEKSTLDDVVETFEQLPARVGIAVALVLVVIGWLLPIVVSGPGYAGPLAQSAKVVVWMFAAAVVVGTAVGAGRRVFDRRRFDSTERIEDLTWRQFEGYLAEYFRRRGSQVTYRGGAAADGGVDLVLDDASGRRIVQAKHWRVRRVGVVPLRALWGVLDDERAQGAVAVTSGTFTPDAVRFAEGKRLELIAGDELRRLVAEVRSTGVMPRPAATVGAPIGPMTATTVSESCPQCGRGVVERKLARKGRNAGSYFLSCNRFPECRYARDM
jgi:restriction system protein